MRDTIRPGELRSAINPAAHPGDARLVFIGRARTAWTDRDTCPKNLSEARARGGDPAHIEVDAPWRAGLRDLSPGEPIVLLTWFDRVRRDLLIQAPHRRDGTAGVFSIRSPVRPNPIGLHVVHLVAVDADAGLLTVDALDCLDGTPLLDIKPWRRGVDIPPGIALGS